MDERRPISLRELEQGMHDLLLPPGLCHPAPSATILSKADTFSIPSPSAPDLYSDFMTQKERDIIANFHLSQLRPTASCSLAPTDDYYYCQASSQRRQGNAGKAAGDVQSLYFPVLQPTTRREKAKVKPTEFKVEGSLGSISKSSHHKPRTQFQPPPPAPRTAADAEVDAEWEAKRVAEDLFGHVLLLEEAQRRLAEDVEASHELQVEYANAIAREQSALLLGVMGAGHCELNQLLAEEKGRRAVGRAVKLLAFDDCLKFITHLFETLDQLSCVQDDGGEAEEAFLNDIMSGCVTFVMRSDADNCMSLLDLIVSKPCLPWLLMRKTGLIVMCMLLSRLEAIKQRQEQTIDELEGFCTHMYSSQLHERMTDIFFASSQSPISSFSTKSHRSSSGRSSSQYMYYVWQLLALIAVNVDGDIKREMVLELREVVMSIIESKNQKAIKNMNVFLNALGLDSSQLDS